MFSMLKNVLWVLIIESVVCAFELSALPQNQGPDSRNILKKKFLLNCHFLLIFNLRKKLRIFYIPKHSS